MEDLFGPVISSYSWNDAVADGTFKVVGPLAKEAGFNCPLAVTKKVDALLNANTKGYESYDGRAWDLLTVLRHAIKGFDGSSDKLTFSPLFTKKGHKAVPVKLQASIGPRSAKDPSACFTVCFPDEN